MQKMNILGERLSFDFIPEISTRAIEKHGKVDGNLGVHVNKDNLPTFLFSIEQKLQIFQQKQYDIAQRYFIKSQEKIGNSLHDSDTRLIKASVLNIVQNPGGLNIDDEETVLNASHTSFKSWRDNYLNFKKLNARSFLPQNSDPSENKFQNRLIITLFITEFLTNSFMLQSGGVLEIKAALAISLSQTAVNIIFCYLGGKMLLGQIQFAEDIVKKISLSIILLFHGFVIFIINANMGIYRNAIVEAVEANRSANVQAIIGHWSWMPWTKIGNLDATAVLLVFFGCLYALIAYIDGYFSDDPYPGYGAVYRDALKAKKNVENKLRIINSKWYETLSQYKTVALNFKQRGLYAIKEWSTEINTHEQVRDDYQAIILQLEKNYAQALKLYVSVYNRYHKDKKISISNVPLLNKNDHDMNRVFKDSKHFFYTDGERLRKEQNMKNEFVRELSKIEKETQILIEKTKDRIKKFSATFACQLA